LERETCREREPTSFRSKAFSGSFFASDFLA
jgi:hypothetical protein